MGINEKASSAQEERESFRNINTGLESMKKTRTRILPTKWVEWFPQKECMTRSNDKLGRLMELGQEENMEFSGARRMAVQA